RLRWAGAPVSPPRRGAGEGTPAVSLASVAKPRRYRCPTVVGDELDVVACAIPDEVGRMVTEGGVVHDGVKPRVAPAGQRVGAEHDDAARVDLAAGVARHVVVHNLAEGRAQQQDAATLEGRRVLALGAELVVLDDAVVPDVDVSGAALLPVVEHQDSLAVA